MEKNYSTMVKAISYDENRHQLFEKIVATYQPKVLVFIQRLVGDAELSADILQETFLAVYAHPQVRGNSEEPESQSTVLKDLQPLIYTIARNKSLDELRRRNKLRFVSFNPVSTNFGVDTSTGHDQEEFNPALEYRLSGPGNKLESQFILSAGLKEAIDQIGRGKLLTFFLHVDGYSYKEIGQLTGDTLSNVKSKIHRSRQSLRQFLESN